MYDSIILRTVARLMLPLLLVLAVFMLIRGHNLPGGGFIGGLVAACAIILQLIAFGPTFAQRVLRVSYIGLAAFGVAVGAAAGLPALLMGDPFLSALWLPEPVPGIGKVGTVLLFDIGVFLTVIGVTTQIALLLAEEPLLFPMASSTEEQAPQGAPEA
jgi:multicomponent Na+:H+ antiporter subunit B